MAWVTRTETYQKVSYTAQRRGKCPICGTWRTRQTTFTATVNPFNKHPDGTPKTYSEIWKGLEAEGEQWRPEPVVFCCQDCVVPDEEDDEL